MDACACVPTCAHTCCVCQNAAAGHLSTVQIDSYTLDPYALDRQSERAQPRIWLCFGGCSYVRTRYGEIVLHPAQPAESGSFFSLARVLPKAQLSLANMSMSIPEMKPRELAGLSTLFKCLLVVANGFSEHSKDSTYLRDEGRIEILNPFPSPPPFLSML